MPQVITIIIMLLIGFGFYFVLDSKIVEPFLYKLLNGPLKSFYIHYIQIIKYEEKSLLENYGQEFAEYKKSTPRLIPNPKSFVRFLRDKLQFGIDKNGFRYNALFVLFPGIRLILKTSRLISSKM